MTSARRAFQKLRGWPKFTLKSPAADCAQFLLVGAHHFSELICWQLARELQREVFKLTGAHTFETNQRLRAQLRDAASSARRNIAEGFGRTTHREFARFLNIAAASLNEVEDELIECQDNGYLQQDQVARVLVLCKRARTATTRLRNVVKVRPDPQQS